MYLYFFKVCFGTTCRWHCEVLFFEGVSVVIDTLLGRSATCELASSMIYAHISGLICLDLPACLQACGRAWVDVSREATSGGRGGMVNQACADLCQDVYMFFAL